MPYVQRMVNTISGVRTRSSFPTALPGRTALFRHWQPRTCIRSPSMAKTYQLGNQGLKRSGQRYFKNAIDTSVGMTGRNVVRWHHGSAGHHSARARRWRTRHSHAARAQPPLDSITMERQSIYDAAIRPRMYALARNKGISLESATRATIHESAAKLRPFSRTSANDREGLAFATPALCSGLLLCGGRRLMSRRGGNCSAPSRASPKRRPRTVNLCRCSSVQPMTAWMTSCSYPRVTCLA